MPILARPQTPPPSTYQPPPLPAAPSVSLPTAQLESALAYALSGLRLSMAPFRAALDLIAPDSDRVARATSAVDYAGGAEPYIAAIAEALGPPLRAGWRTVSGAAAVPVPRFMPTDAAEWARLHAGALVVDVREKTRAWVAGVVSAGIREGASVDTVANRLHMGLGLHDRWARAVVRYQERLLAEGVPRERAMALTRSYRERLVMARAMTVARTELLRASAEGRLRAYAYSFANGGLGSAVEKVWHTAPEVSKRGRVVCPICRPLGGKVVAGFSGEFAPGILIPPIHPNCRCSFIVRPVGGPALTPAPEPSPAPEPAPVVPGDFASEAAALVDAYKANPSEEAARRLGTVVRSEVDRRWAIESHDLRVAAAQAEFEAQDALDALANYASLPWDESQRRWERRHRTRSAADAANAVVHQGRARVVAEVLGALRPMGLASGGRIDFAAGTAAKARAMVNEVARFLPRDWLDAHNGYARPMRASWVTGRGAYTHRFQTTMGGAYRTISLLRTGAYNRDPESTTLHELAHRMEQVKPSLMEREREFWMRRTGDGARLRHYAKGRKGEWVDPDRFADEYVGKVYFPMSLAGRRLPAAGATPWEVLATGLQRVYFGWPKVTTSGWADDTEHVDFVLGLLAGA